MIVTVEPLRIGKPDGPIVWMVVRRVGAHLDIEEAPINMTSECEVIAWAARRWKVPQHKVKLAPEEFIDIVADRDA